MKFIQLLIIIVIQIILSPSLFAQEQWVGVEPAVRNVTITGFTRARAKMPLISEVSGKVIKIYADIGEPIPASEKFACLDDTFVNIDIQSAQSEISQHYVDINYYKKEVSRHEKLVKRQTSAISILDGLKRNLNNARKAATIASLRKQRLEELKRRHCIKTPAGWLVIDRNIETDQWVNEGQVLAHAGNYAQLLIPLTLSHQELQSLKNNQSQIEVFFPEVRTKAIATIEHISPGFDEKTRKILVDLLIDQFPEVIHGGMRAELTLAIADNKSSTFVIPKGALDERFEEYWLERKGDGKRIRVKLLANPSDNQVKIISNEIKLGDQFKLFQH